MRRIFGRKKNNFFIKGFTLIELIIYAGLLSFVLLVIASFLTNIADFKQNNRVINSFYQNTVLIKEKIKSDISKANELVFPLDENFSNSLILKTDSETISYTCKNGVLKRNEEILTDKRVKIILEPPFYGFRKIGKSLQLKLKIVSQEKISGQGEKSENFQTAFVLPE